MGEFEEKIFNIISDHKKKNSWSLVHQQLTLMSIESETQRSEINKIGPPFLRGEPTMKWYLYN